MMPVPPEQLAAWRRLSGIWCQQEGLPGPEVNRLLDDAVPALLGEVERLRALLELGVRGCLDPGGGEAFKGFVVALAEWRDGGKR